MAYFGNNPQRGELQELYADLNDLNFEKKKEAVKKVIAYMTVGKDVSDLFQSVIKCLEFNDIEMKKLIYLYIVNYSRQKPDDAIMVIQNFRKDVRKSENPLVRALAIRTFGCLRVPKLNEYLIEPLKDCIQDDDPYVRKTAVLCVPKVYEVSPEICPPLLELLQKLLEKESNALVLANLIQSMREIEVVSGKQIINLNQKIIQKLLLAVDECIEWGQIFILDYLASYNPQDSKQAEVIIERTLPRLSHINPTVTFCAVKVILKYLDFLDNGDLVKNLCKKVAPSLISLLSWNQPEVQYTILRNISLILQKFPILFENEVKVFFCSFNEPYYIKYEKLDIMVRICDSKNFGQVLNELLIYLNEADPHFVRKAIKSIGKIAITYDKALDKAVSILVEFAKNVQQPTEPVQELLIQMQLIYKKNKSMYKHEDSLKFIYSIIEYANEPESKSACAWILGEFGEYIPKSAEKMKEYIDNFQMEDRLVQLQLLTSAVQLYLKYPSQCSILIQQLITSAKDSFNPDVRDRTYIYWRLLSTDPEIVKTLVCFNSGAVQNFSKDLRLWETQDLVLALENMGSISNLFHKLPHQLYKNIKIKINNQQDIKIYKGEEKQEKQENQAQVQQSENQQNNKQEQQQQQQDIDLLSFDDPPVNNINNNSNKANLFELI
ncbi:unnamed protein product (macronuclear) [Paramecium tetraurelia]|uniref:AP complex subunit beta n=1 Tax=Paramecium tetraurelia TaxID=5888 RepID=A0DC58_PARTE|nr:uncharacterized protein GSPATT00015502001 [Paramecium tetraurelia]CAK80625.1 unnamed protein product [Paramecium tetraurelia]|eukprot:XP_001448022.1 hypothetical protein (macronuclear) [Paramecium tetraurelia strain d4-2]